MTTSTLRGRALWAPDVVEARLRDTRLRTLLRLNAAFSPVTGAVAAAAAGPVAERSMSRLAGWSGSSGSGSCCTRSLWWWS
jgi:hypothetical protein